jgi:hypothetical protein
MNHEERVYCGVDVSKDHLDVLFNANPTTNGGNPLCR